MNKALKQAIKGLTNNPARTALTTLGIVIGISTVILVLSAGEGFRSYITSQVESFGTNTVFIETKVPPTTKNRGNQNSFDTGTANQAVAITTLKNRDVADIKRLPNVANAYGMVVGQKSAAYQNVRKNAMIMGADPDRFKFDKGVLSRGRFYTEQENTGADQVAVLGSDIADDLFGQDDPVGKTLRIDAYNFQIIGVYEQRGGFNGEDQQIFIPLVTAQKKLLGIDYLFMIIGQLEDQNLSEVTALDIKDILRKNHSITDPVKDDFMVTTQAQGLETLGTILSGISFLLIGIATISLVVGGVGIMNIMYVVVTERISEIGLKKAVGAKSSDILNEFLLEAILLTVLGGIIGIIVGAGLSYLVALVANAFDFNWKFVVPASGIFLGLGVSTVIGLIFGVFPARRAAKMNPIEALRYE